MKSKKYFSVLVTIMITITFVKSFGLPPLGGGGIQIPGATKSLGGAIALNRVGLNAVKVANNVGKQTNTAPNKAAGDVKAMGKASIQMSREELIIKNATRVLYSGMCEKLLKLNNSADVSDTKVKSDKKKVCEGGMEKITFKFKSQVEGKMMAFIIPKVLRDKSEKNAQLILDASKSHQVQIQNSVEIAKEIDIELNKYSNQCIVKAECVVPNCVLRMSIYQNEYHKIVDDAIKIHKRVVEQKKMAQSGGMFSMFSQPSGRLLRGRRNWVRRVDSSIKKKEVEGKRRDERKNDDRRSRRQVTKEEEKSKRKLVKDTGRHQRFRQSSKQNSGKNIKKVLPLTNKKPIKKDKELKTPSRTKVLSKPSQKNLDGKTKPVVAKDNIEKPQKTKKDTPVNKKPEATEAIKKRTPIIISAGERPKGICYLRKPNRRGRVRWVRVHKYKKRVEMVKIRSKEDEGKSKMQLRYKRRYVWRKRKNCFKSVFTVPRKRPRGWCYFTRRGGRLIRLPKFRRIYLDHQYRGLDNKIHFKKSFVWKARSSCPTMPRYARRVTRRRRRRQKILPAGKRPRGICYVRKPNRKGALVWFRVSRYIKRVKLVHISRLSRKERERSKGVDYVRKYFWRRRRYCFKRPIKIPTRRPRGRCYFTRRQRNGQVKIINVPKYRKVVFWNRYLGLDDKLRHVKSFVWVKMRHCPKKPEIKKKKPIRIQPKPKRLMRSKPKPTRPVKSKPKSRRPILTSKPKPVPTRAKPRRPRKKEPYSPLRPVFIPGPVTPERLRKAKIQVDILNEQITSFIQTSISSLSAEEGIIKRESLLEGIDINYTPANRRCEVKFGKDDCMLVSKYAYAYKCPRGMHPVIVSFHSFECQRNTAGLLKSELFDSLKDLKDGEDLLQFPGKHELYFVDFMD